VVIFTSTVFLLLMTTDINVRAKKDGTNKPQTGWLLCRFLLGQLHDSPVGGRGTGVACYIA